MTSVARRLSVLHEHTGGHHSHPPDTPVLALRVARDGGGTFGRGRVGGGTGHRNRSPASVTRHRPPASVTGLGHRSPESVCGHRSPASVTGSGHRNRHWPRSPAPPVFGYNGTMSNSDDFLDNDPGSPGRGGCLRVLAAAPVLAVLAPAVAAYRSWMRRRRGHDIVVSTQTVPFDGHQSGWAKISASIDIPHSLDGRRLVTQCIVRVAELVGCTGEVYHLIHRESGRDETISVPVGTSINDLAERFVLSCGQSILDGRTLVWPALLRGHHLGEFLDPMTYDPEAPGEPDNALQKAPISWAMILKRRRGAASTTFSLVFIIPHQQRAKVEAAIHRLSTTR